MGVYKVYTGTWPVFLSYEYLTLTRTIIDHTQNRTGDVSWWPKVQQWEGGTFDVGYWSPFAEVWFQMRLDRIRCNEAQPKGTNAWRNDMKSAHNAKRVTQALRRTSQAFVESSSGHYAWLRRAGSTQD